MKVKKCDDPRIDPWIWEMGIGLEEQVKGG
jgi:hypothetical protein